MRAFTDASHGSVEAVVWLASHDAEQWFDWLDLSQSEALKRSKWRDWASVALEGPLTTKQRLVLDQTLFYLAEHT